MRPLYLLLLPLLAISCKKDKQTATPIPVTPTIPTTLVKFMNACFNCGDVDVRINGTLLSNQEIGYLESTGYVEVKAGAEVSLAFVDKATGTTLIQKDTILDKSVYHLIAFGGKQPNDLAMICRPNLPNSFTKPYLGFYNFYLKSGSSLLFSVNGEKFDEPTASFGFGEYTFYRNIDIATSYSIVAQDTNDPGFQFTATMHTLMNSRAYVVFFSGKDGEAGAGTPKFTLVETDWK